jgi:hypothetical protein
MSDSRSIVALQVCASLRTVGTERKIQWRASRRSPHLVLFCLHFVVRRDLKILMPRGAFYFEMDGLEMVFALKYF